MIRLYSPPSADAWPREGDSRRPRWFARGRCGRVDPEDLSIRSRGSAASRRLARAHRSLGRRHGGGVGHGVRRRLAWILRVGGRLARRLGAWFRSRPVLRPCRRRERGDGHGGEEKNGDRPVHAELPDDETGQRPAESVVPCPGNAIRPRGSPGIRRSATAGIANPIGIDGRRQDPRPRDPDDRAYGEAERAGGRWRQDPQKPAVRTAQPVPAGEPGPPHAQQCRPGGPQATGAQSGRGEAH